MPKFDANLSLLYPEHAFLDRFAAAAAAGFRAAEILFPYAYAPEERRRLLAANGLELVLINMPPGEWEAGERGLAALPGREQAFEASLERALDYARVLGVPRVHVMAGIPGARVDRDAARATFVANLKRASRRAL